MGSGPGSHRWARRTLAVVITLDLLVAGGVVALHSRDSADPYSATDALAGYRAGDAPFVAPSSTTSTVAATAASTTSTVTEPVPGDTAANAVPVPAPATASTATTVAAPEPTPALSFADEGVYVYDTDGYEHLDALGGARHDYPEETTIVVRRSECGVTEQWQPLEERVDIRQLCEAGDGHRLDWYDSYHSFFGASDHRRLDCEPDSVWLTATTSPGDVTSFSCSDPETHAVNRVEWLGIEPVTIDGVTIQALHGTFSSEVTGTSSATSVQEAWVHPDSGLTLRKTASLDGTSPGPGGDVHYHEEYELVLRSLTPLR